MKHTAALFLAIFLATAARAELVFEATGAKPGVYYYSIQVGADGSLIARPIKNIVSIANNRPQPPPDDDPPDVPDPPDDPPEETLADVAYKLALRVNDPSRRNTAVAIAKIYEEVGKLAGTLRTVEQLQAATDVLYDAALGATGKLDAWRAWKRQIDDLLAQYDISEARLAWQDIAKGLKRVGNGANRRQAANRRLATKKTSTIQVAHHEPTEDSILIDVNAVLTGKQPWPLATERPADLTTTKPRRYALTTTD